MSVAPHGVGFAGSLTAALFTLLAHLIVSASMFLALLVHPIAKAVRAATVRAAGRVKALRAVVGANPVLTHLSRDIIA